MDIELEGASYFHQTLPVGEGGGGGGSLLSSSKLSYVAQSVYVKMSLPNVCALSLLLLLHVNAVPQKIFFSASVGLFHRIVKDFV